MTLREVELTLSSGERGEDVSSAHTRGLPWAPRGSCGSSECVLYNEEIPWKLGTGFAMASVAEPGGREWLAEQRMGEC